MQKLADNEFYFRSRNQRFESIHPFQDGNGRVGRLIMFKECLANGIVPFIITEELRRYKDILDYFRIKF